MMNNNKVKSLNLIYSKILDIQSDIEKIFDDYYEELDLIRMDRISYFIKEATYTLEEILQYEDLQEVDTL